MRRTVQALGLALALLACGATGSATVAAKNGEDAGVPAEVTLDLGQEGPKADAIPADATEAEVVEVVDGDTIKVRDAEGGRAAETETVRLIGIDTPETRDPNDPGECYGAEATAYSRSLFPEGGTVWLEHDVSDTDRYDRLLRYVWIEDDGGAYLANELLVREGYAVVSTYPPDVKHVERLTDAQDAATDEQAGLWAECGGADTPLDLAAEPTPTEVVEPLVTECGVFGSFEEAQDYYADNPDAAPDLDPNGDGRACEIYFGVDQAPVEEAPADEPAAPTGGGCDPNYPDVCIPPYPPDLDCAEVGYNDIRVTGSDPHGLDGRDNDGLGCES